MLNTKVAHYARYLSYYRYGKISKHINLIRALYSWFVGKEHISSKPAFLKVEISRSCGLACLICLTKKEHKFFPLDEFKVLIDKLKNYIYLVSLYDIGEPLENDDVCEYIRYAKDRKIGASISSHMSLERPDSFWENLVLSGLHTLIVAVDGTTAEVYNRYRRGGDFNLVIENIKKVIYYKKKHGVRMTIEWQTVSFKWNVHQLEDAGKMAYELGCDNFRVIQDAGVRLKYKKQNQRRVKNCILPYLIFIVTALKEIRPCYKFYKVPNFVGDYSTGGFDGNWNNDEIKRIRCSKKIQDREPCNTCVE